MLDRLEPHDEMKAPFSWREIGVIAEGASYAFINAPLSVAITHAGAGAKFPNRKRGFTPETVAGDRCTKAGMKR